MFPLANGQTLVRLRRRLAIDPYSGEPTLADWSDPHSLTLEGVAIAPSSSVEAPTDNRTQVITQMSIYCGPEQDVAPADRIRAGAVVWDVVGEVADWTNPFTGWSPGAEFRIRKVDG